MLLFSIWFFVSERNKKKWCLWLMHVYSIVFEPTLYWSSPNIYSQSFLIILVLFILTLLPCFTARCTEVSHFFSYYICCRYLYCGPNNICTDAATLSNFFILINFQFNCFSGKLSQIFFCYHQHNSRDYAIRMLCTL